MPTERQEIIEAIRQRLRSHREHVLRQIHGQWSEIFDADSVPDDGGADAPALEEVRRTETALDQIRAGNYGRCMKCSREIAGERLEVIPFATVCIPCQLADLARKTV
jgi:RNA polymerase-binding transcription factor DksA